MEQKPRKCIAVGQVKCEQEAQNHLKPDTESRKGPAKGDL